MKRRVVEQGGLTLMISLPRKWAKQHQLKKGDELELVERGKELILSTPKGIEEEKGVVVEITDTKKFMGRLIHTPYRFGYDEVEIKYQDPTVVPQIQHYLEQLLGFEIVEQGANHMKIEMVAKEVEEEFDKMLRRVFMMVLDMARELASAAKEVDNKKLKELAARGNMTNRMTNFCERLLNKHGYTEIKKTNFMYCTVWAMEQVADEISEICKVLIESKASDSVNKFLEDYTRYVDQFIKLFYKHSNDDLWNFRDSHNRFLNLINDSKTNTKTEFKVAALITSSVEKMRHITFSLA